MTTRRAEGQAAPMVFALDGADDPLARSVAAALQLPLAPWEQRRFEDGEYKWRPLEAVAEAEVYVLAGLHGGPGESVHDKLCRLLFFLGAVRDGGAARLTAVLPYLCYARKDRRTKPHDPLTTRYLAQLLEAVGIDCVVMLEPHNPAAVENAFRCRTVSLTAAPLFVEHLRNRVPGKLAVVSPDPGGVKRAELFREAIEQALGRPVGKGFADKHRSGGKVSGELFVGEVKDATVLIIDDLISTGGTLLRAARGARAAGAAAVWALATHGLFMDGAAEALGDPAIDRLIVCDSVPSFRLPAGAARDKLEIVPCGPLLAEAIARLHEGRDFSDLLVF